MEDVHQKEPQFSIPIQLVGVKGVKMPVAFVKFGGRAHYTLPVFDAYINLPSTMKGIHASRHYEVISEVLSYFAMKAGKLEDICRDMAMKLLEKHEYASQAYVKARSEIVFEDRVGDSDLKSFEPCVLTGRAWAFRSGLEAVISSRKAIGVSVKGMTACPCALEYVKEKAKAAIDENSLTYIPLATHLQRVTGTILIEVPHGFDVDAMKLVEIIQKSMSSPTYGLLKRNEEGEMICRAVSNPRFAEDVIRFMVIGILKEFRNYPDSTFFECYVRSEESIHKHDLVARQRGTIGRLRSKTSKN